MDYLYGDSSPSPLQSDFLGFLGDTLDFAVQVLLADERMKRGRAQIGELRSAADAEGERLLALAAVVKRAAEEAPKGEAESPTARCASAIITEVEAVLRAETARVRGALETDVARLEESEKAERESCRKVLERLLLRHDPPDTSWSLHLERRVGEELYEARLSGASRFGLTWTLELDIPSTHVLGQVVRVDKLVPHLEVDAPELGGWLRKEVKIRPQRLERFYITQLVITPKTMTIKLRAEPDGEGAGFDVEIRAEAPHVRLVRAGAQNEAPHDLTPTDATKVHELHEKLLGAAEEIAFCRKRLLEATLDDVPFVESEPKSAIERLIAAVTPVVQQIAQHSLTPKELVLKRLLGDNRREEVFASKAVLAEKLAFLPEPLRIIFKPLGLGEPGLPAKPAPPPVPKPPVPASPRISVHASDGQREEGRPPD